MMKRRLYFFYMVFGSLIIFFGLYGYMQHRERPGIPPEILDEIVLQDNISSIEIDGYSLTVEGRHVKKTQAREIEFILRKKTPGDVAIIVINADGESREIQAVLQPFYVYAPVPLINLIIGLICVATGFLVFVLRPQSKKARVYYWATITFYFTLCVTEGTYALGRHWFSQIPATLYYGTFSFIAALFLHFSFQFTHVRWKLRRWTILFMVYGPAVVFSVLSGSLFLISSIKDSIEIYNDFLNVLFALRFYVIFYLSFAVIHFIRIFRISFLEEQRARIKWALFGLVVGLIPFIFLFQLPDLMGLTPFISQDWSNVLLIFIPITLAISILRYKLLDIELVINKSLVYGMLTVMTVSVYLIFVRFFQNMISRWFLMNNFVSFGLAAFVAASSFHLARKKIQDFVDRSFYRVSYDYKKSIKNFIERAQKMASSDQLLEFYILKIEQTLPVEKMGIVIFDGHRRNRTLLIQRKRIPDLDDLADLGAGQDLLYAKRTSVQTEVGMDFSCERLLKENNVALAFPPVFPMTNMSGIIYFGEKKSGGRYSHEDIELLMTLSQEFVLNLERIRLQETVFFEKAEKAKLEELNHIKTEFISTVSHEIRTPMTSIHSLSELLKSGKIKDSEKQGELLELITTECTRLSRFLHNIIEFGKIERDAKQYDFERTDIQSLVEDTLRLFQARMSNERFELETSYPEKPVWLAIDTDAIKQSLTNLIDNAMKYSENRRAIELSVLELDEHVEIRVKDSGVGIPKNEQDKIFQGFYRCRSTTHKSREGVGLGLKVVKSIMEAHDGFVQVKSKEGKGSTFSLIFRKK